MESDDNSDSNSSVASFHEITSLTMATSTRQQVQASPWQQVQAHRESRLSWSLKSYVVMYSDAMKTCIDDVVTFEQFLYKEEEANTIVIEKLREDFADSQSESCFCVYTSELEKQIHEERKLFENKFLLKQTRLISQKMQQVIVKYNDKMKTSSSVGITQKELEKIHEKATQAAEDQLQVLPALAYDHNLWTETKAQFAHTISMLKEQHYQLNSLHLAHKKTASGNLANTKIEATMIKIDKSKMGLLGRGNYGTVRLGFIKHYGTVAVKAMRFCGSGLRIENAEKNFTKEIDLLHYANHDNIVRILGYTSWKDSMAIVMEYMLEGSLSDLLHSRKDREEFLVPDISLHESLRLRLCSDISHGVSYLHFAFSDQRMVHGDLKPSNILLSGDLRCKIGDFGGADIATCTEVQSSSSKKPKHKSQWTRGYIAPERMNNPQHRVSKAMDVYSVGMIFYVILRRQQPVEDIKQNL